MTRLIAVCMLLLVSASASAQTTYFTKPNGNPNGYLRQENGGSRLVERSNNGNQLGYWQKSGNQWEHRAPNGNLLGRAKTRP